VNQAARLTTEAKQRLGRVLASEDAISRAGSEARWWTVAGEMHLRGYDEPTLVYEPAPHSHAGIAPVLAQHDNR
jgi:class 3 adenylate cyclase